MDKIVLDVNLKFVLAQLSLVERGELLSALFDGAYDGSNAAVANVFYYINDLQQKYAVKKQKMHDLSVKSAIARKSRSANAELMLEQPLLKRKEAKENDIINKNNLLFSADDFKKKKPKSSFVPPSVAEVKNYIAENHLLADAETFINFYESHGWMVGTTPIKSWQATLKLWHARNSDKKQKQNDDEAYWNELSGRVLDRQNKVTENNHE